MKSARIATIHQVTLTVIDVEPPVWRQLLIPSESTLHQVHVVFQTAMGWENYHRYQFRVGETTYLIPDEDWPNDSIDPATASLGDLVGPGDRFVYEYDFGDGWEHEVVVEDVLPAAGHPRPVCLAGRRACPPEDVGGPGGYENFLEAISDPEHPEHAEFLEWAGGSFDPNAFDADEVDRLLALG